MVRCGIYEGIARTDVRFRGRTQAMQMGLLSTKGSREAAFDGSLQYTRAIYGSHARAREG